MRPGSTDAKHAFNLVHWADTSRFNLKFIATEIVKVTVLENTSCRINLALFGLILQALISKINLIKFNVFVEFIGLMGKAPIMH